MENDHTAPEPAGVTTSEQLDAALLLCREIGLDDALDAPARLAECGLVTWKRQGRFVHYELAAKRVGKLLDSVEALLGEIGPLIEACPRYRRPPRTDGTRKETTRP